MHELPFPAPAGGSVSADQQDERRRAASLGTGACPPDGRFAGNLARGHAHLRGAGPDPPPTGIGNIRGWAGCRSSRPGLELLESLETMAERLGLEVTVSDLHVESVPADAESAAGLGVAAGTPADAGPQGDARGEPTGGLPGGHAACRDAKAGAARARLPGLGPGFPAEARRLPEGVQGGHLRDGRPGPSGQGAADPARRRAAGVGVEALSYRWTACWTIRPVTSSQVSSTFTSCGGFGAEARVPRRPDQIAASILHIEPGGSNAQFCRS